MAKRGLIPDGGGHVFVVHGDLTKVACDAWMLPTDEKLQVESYWHLDFELPPKPVNWASAGVRTLKLDTYGSKWCQPWLVNVGGHNLPACKLCSKQAAVLYCEADKANLCGRCDEIVHSHNSIVREHKRVYCADIQWYVEGAEAFFLSVFEDLKDRPPQYDRARHLVALPLVGTGKGGAGEATGGVATQLLPAMYAAVEAFGYDIALVMNNRSKFAAVQVLRERLQSSRSPSDSVWKELNELQIEEAKKLAQHARTGNLVLFLGAGVSTGAGLPTWSSLLRDLARTAGLSDEEIDVINALPYLDAARIVELHLGGTSQLNTAVAQRVAVKCCTLLSCLLSGLPIKEAVTTNYDTMFETASKGAGLETAVLPYKPASNSHRWLLKMHGCAEHPEDIVLTREDFMRYTTRRSALQGIVQSLLITRHMLFVGFSLQDDNFHKIVDEVRRALQSTDKSREGTGAGKAFGTSVSLIRNHIVDMLWREDLNMIAMVEPAVKEGHQILWQRSQSASRLRANSLELNSPDRSQSITLVAGLASPNSPARDQSGFKSTDVITPKKATIMVPDRATIAWAARRLEIFMDYLLSESTSTAAFLLQPQFDSMLTEDQRELRTSIMDFLDKTSTKARNTKEWNLVQKLMQTLGAAGPPEENAFNSSSWIA